MASLWGRHGIGQSKREFIARAQKENRTTTFDESTEELNLNQAATQDGINFYAYNYKLGVVLLEGVNNLFKTLAGLNEVAEYMIVEKILSNTTSVHTLHKVGVNQSILIVELMKKRKERAAQK